MNQSTFREIVRDILYNTRVDGFTSTEAEIEAINLAHEEEVKKAFNAGLVTQITVKEDVKNELCWPVKVNIKNTVKHKPTPGEDDTEVYQ